VVGHSLDDTMKEKGLTLLNFAGRNIPVVKSKMFPRNDIHKGM